MNMKHSKMHSIDPYRIIILVILYFSSRVSCKNITDPCCSGKPGLIKLSDDKVECELLRPHVLDIVDINKNKLVLPLVECQDFAQTKYKTDFTCNGFVLDGRFGKPSEDKYDFVRIECVMENNDDLVDYNIIPLKKPSFANMNLCCNTVQFFNETSQKCEAMPYRRYARYLFSSAFRPIVFVDVEDFKCKKRMIEFKNLNATKVKLTDSFMVVPYLDEMKVIKNVTIDLANNEINYCIQPTSPNGTDFTLKICEEHIMNSADSFRCTRIQIVQLLLSLSFLYLVQKNFVFIR